MGKRKFDNVQVNVEFETAEELQNLTSGESLNSALGKVDRVITEIKELQGSQAIAEYTVKRPGGKSKAIRLFTVELGRAYGESCGISILFNAHSTMTAKDQVGILHIGEISYIGDKPVGPCWLINGSPTVEYQSGYLRDIVKARVYSGNIEVWADASTTDNWDEVNYTLLGDPKNHVGDSAGLITFDNVTTDTLLDAMLGGYGLTLTLYPIDMAIIDGLGGTFEEVREEIASLKAVSGKQTSSTTASGGKNVYTITFADGSTSDLNVYNGAKGDKGDTGAAGAKGDTGAAGAKGDKGDAGTAATITIGTVTTGAAGSKASVTNAGTTSAAKLNFTIPQGAQGNTGAAGKDGLTTAVSIGGKKYTQVDGTITVPDSAVQKGVTPVTPTSGQIAQYDGTTGKLKGINSVSIANGGTGAASAAEARQNLRCPLIINIGTLSNAEGYYKVLSLPWRQAWESWQLNILLVPSNMSNNNFRPSRGMIYLTSNASTIVTTGYFTDGVALSDTISILDNLFIAYDPDDPTKGWELWYQYQRASFSWFSLIIESVVGRCNDAVAANNIPGAMIDLIAVSDTKNTPVESIGLPKQIQLSTVVLSETQNAINNIISSFNDSRSKISTLSDTVDTLLVSMLEGDD